MDEKTNRLLEAAEAVLVRHDLWMGSVKGRLIPPLPETLEAFARLRAAVADLKEPQQ